MKWLFVPVPSGKPWNGSTVHTDPLGGSEAAVAYTAQALAKLGEQVTVVAHGAVLGAQNQSYYGVTYIHPNYLQSMVEHSEWDVVVSSRWLEALTWNWKTQVKLYWLHDMPGERQPIAAHKVVCVSQFQADAWGLVPEYVEVIGNGIDPNVFNPGSDERDRNRVLWTSNPDRGLWIAAKIFQDVRKRWPNLELHVYGRAGVYGWGPEMEDPYMPLPEHMDNVYIHDPLPRYALATELKKAWAWFYPTYWPETYCIAALEAQGCGTPVIASPLAALNETVQGGILSYDYLNAFSQLRNTRRWQKLSSAGVTYAQDSTWEKRAHQWLEVVNGFKK